VSAEIAGQRLKACFHYGCAAIVSDSETQISSLFNGNIATFRSLSFTIADYRSAAQRRAAQRSAAVVEMPLKIQTAKRRSNSTRWLVDSGAAWRAQRTLYEHRQIICLAQWKCWRTFRSLFAENARGKSASKHDTSAVRPTNYSLSCFCHVYVLRWVWSNLHNPIYSNKGAHNCGPKSLGTIKAPNR